MFSPTRKLIIAALVCAVLFAVGMTKLFLMRFEAGDVYPPYSSLRTDPLGTRVLFESLNRTAAETAFRNYRPWKQVPLDPETTFMVIGLHDSSLIWGRDRVEKLLDRLAHSGGRLVLTFSATSRSWIDADEEDESADTVDEASTDAENSDPVEKDSVVEKEGATDAECEEKKDADKDSDCGCDQWESRYGMNALGFRIATAAEMPTEDVAFRFARDPDFLPQSIPWRSPLSFELEDNSWETLYTWQGAPAIVQRPWGQGTVVLAADSYLFSNEALRNHRATGLLAWIMTPGNGIVFDEFNKGIVKQPGVAGLARQYRLHGVFAALLVVAMLFVWHQSAIFVPSEQAAMPSSHPQPAAGRDTGQGVVHLARQHIGAGELLGVCYNAWKSTAAQRISQANIDEVGAMVERASTDPRKEIQVQTYKEICELLKQGKRS